MAIIKAKCISNPYNSKYITIGETYKVIPMETLPCNVSNMMAYVTGVNDSVIVITEYNGKEISGQYPIEYFNFDI